ncbi:MAG TPA: zinc metalloprotease HtpX [Streptosporangiaceae bacterium]|nr:zinc metalloprotease HtpX [Streptosporangiaceae bacterium]
MNNVKTWVLMAGLMGLFLLAGQLLGGSQGFVLALILGSAFNFIMYFFSDKIVLRMYGAQVVTEEQAPELYRMVDRLRQRAGLPMPAVAIAPHEQPNAFATGRNPNHAVVAVTTGILKYVPQEELEGVLAHELAHVKNRDMLITTIAAGMAGAISNLPYLLLFGGRSDDDGHPLAQLALLLLAPLGAMLIQFGVSRQREFEADRVGAQILGRPLPLANALRRLDALAHRIPMEVAPAAAPLAQVNPLAAQGGGMAKLFSTHPPTEERVARLEAMAAGN